MIKRIKQEPLVIAAVIAVAALLGVEQSALDAVLTDALQVAAGLAALWVARSKVSPVSQTQ